MLGFRAALLSSAMAVVTSAPIEYVGGYILGDDSQANPQTVPLDSLTGGIDTKPKAGDLVVVTWGWSLNRYDPLTMTTPGYTVFCEEQFYTSSGLVHHFAGAYKVLDSAETTVQVSSSANVSAGAIRMVQVWRNVDPVTPMDATPEIAFAAGTGQANPPRIYPETPGAIVFAAGGGGYIGSSLYTSSDLNNFVTDFADGSFGMTMGGGSLPYVGDSIDPAQFGGGNTSGNAGWVSYSIALRPTTPGVLDLPFDAAASKVSASGFFIPDQSVDRASKVSASAFFIPDQSVDRASKVSASAFFIPDQSIDRVMKVSAAAFFKPTP